MALTFLILFITFKVLKVYTRHGESITLPDFTGMTLDKVKQQLDNEHLLYKIQDSLYVADKEPYTVLIQDPPANSSVKENRTIYFTINSPTPPLVTLPYVWGNDLKFARKKLEARGLVIDEDNITYKKDKAENTILELSYDGKKLTKPKKKEKNTEIKLPKGALLQLVVAESTEGEISVPTVICHTYSEAIFKIKSSNLNVGSIVIDGSVSDTSSAYIYQQSPPSGEMEIMRMGEQVDLWLTKNKPGSCF